MTEQRAGLAPDRARITAVRPGLLAADIKLGRAVNRICGRRGSCKGRDRLKRFWLTFRSGVGAQTFPAAFTTETAFAHTAETGGGIHHVGAVDPDNTGCELWRDIECQVDVLTPDTGGKTVA